MLQDIRKQYEQFSISKKDLSENPFSQFKLWLDAAIQSVEIEPTAMVVSTVDKTLQPHSRVVLLKELTDEGFVFYTNYQGHKAMQIEHNSKVSLLFFWQSLERQVRITGVCEKLTQAQSTEYFKSRPLESQIGAWTSPQSQVIPDHQFLEDSFVSFQNKFSQDVPKPPHWGGYLVRVSSFEFWQGRPNRLHDRFYYSKAAEQDGWQIDRLAP